MTDNKFTISMDDEHFEKLEKMVAADDVDRSKFIRRLIRREWEFRNEYHVVSITDLEHPKDAVDIPQVVTMKVSSHEPQTGG